MSQAETSPAGDTDRAAYEAVVLFWIRTSRLAEGMDRRLLDILRPWFEDEWAFDGHLFMTNEQCEDQVATFEEANLQLQFEVKFPKKAGKDLAYL